MSALNIVFGWQMQVVDNTTNQTVVNASQTGMTLAGNAYFCDQYYQVQTTGSAINLPNATVWSILIQNKGNNNITVQGTPNGSATATLGVVAPGAVWIYHSLTDASGAGYTSLTLTAASAVTPASVFVGY